MLLLLIIGIGGFCTAAGGVLHNVFPTVVLEDIAIEDIRVPLPDSVDTPNLSLEFGGGQLFLNPGAETALVEGTATYNVAALKPQVVITNGRNIQLQPEGDIGLGGIATEGLENKWDLKLNSTPMALAIETGGADTAYQSFVEAEPVESGPSHEC